MQEELNQTPTSDAIAEAQAAASQTAAAQLPNAGAAPTPPPANPHASAGGYGDESWQEPKKGKPFVKFEDGKSTTLRILTKDPLKCFRAFVDGKPMYKPYDTTQKKLGVEAFDDIQLDANKKGDKPQEPAACWVQVVWNYETKRIELWEITQKTIRDEIQALARNPQWGEPSGYDLTMSRFEENGFTKYRTVPSPHSVVSAEIQNAYMEASPNLENLLVGKDPFDDLPF